MNTLETLKNILKKKDIVGANDGVKIVLISKQGDPVNMKITMESDNGQQAMEILKQMRQQKMINVSTKFQEPKLAVMEPKAPEFDTRRPIISKLKGKVGLEEEAEETDVLIGPQLEDNSVREVVKPRLRVITKRMPTNVIPLGPEANITIGDTSLLKRLPPPPEYIVAASSYYMNNREIFVNFVNGLFNEYKEDLQDESKNISCEDIGKDTGEIGLLTHQKIVRDYINLYTPYRGLLLFHGLGSGKTCSSIAIAEGIKSGGKQVIIMTPASLRRNYLEEIKKCGDLIYRKNQFWEWVSVVDNPEYMNRLASALGFQTTDYISRKKGAWLTNVTKASNYNQLSTTDKKSLNDQLDEMIRQKYRFINYNGLRRNSFQMLTNNFKNNIFDNSIVIIDEAHNLISRIVNNINKSTKFIQRNKRDTNTLAAEPLAIQIYDYLMRADNCRVVLLTGTPIINYPNEIGVLFNILRGYIKTWNLPLNFETSQKITKETILGVLSNNKNMDYIDYNPSSKTLVITRNPFGFESITDRSMYQGVKMVNDRGIMSDAEFLKGIEWKLSKSDININKTGITYEVYTALPDTLDEFNNTFIDKNSGNVVNIEKFKRRIIGLTSYFRSAQEDLLPRYDKHFDKHVVLIPMSDYQFKIYENYRHEERKNEKPGKKTAAVGNTLKEPSSTYRIFSRLACNFVMPTPPGRPIPKEFLKGTIVKEKITEEEMEKDLKIPNQNQNKPNEVLKAVDKKNQKALELAKKALEKADADARKALEKEQIALQKVEEKAKKERIKTLEKEQKILQKVEEKAKKERIKALKKGTKGGADTPDEEDEDEDLVEDDIENNLEDEVLNQGLENEDEEFIGSNRLEELLNDPDHQDDIVEIEGIKDIDAKDRDYDELEGDELLDAIGDADYKEAISKAYAVIKKYKSEYLSPEKLKIYSPKFLSMLDNIESPDHRGLHLVYSQFRSMEGIGIFALVLEANGFAHFKIKKTGLDSWEINMSEEDMGKPTYALYTGTEDSEEREILRNIYNGTWDNIPNNIAAQLRRKSSNNNLGEIVKVLMITSAGSEGINLRNTRYVHIMEPYWHPVRTEQVIGRARRICSHKDLPIELQTVEVFIYIMTFTQAQLDSEGAIELRIKSQDRSKIAPYPVQTSDEKLYEISTIKEKLSTQILMGIKEASIDCATYTKSNTKEGLVCLAFGQPSASDFSYNPNISQDENDTTAAINRVTVNWEARPFTDRYGKQYMLRQDTNQVYDYDSVIQAQKIPGVRPILLGKLVKDRNGNYEIIRERM
jgi:hypothetical protein